MEESYSSIAKKIAINAHNSGLTLSDLKYDATFQCLPKPIQQELTTLEKTGKSRNVFREVLAVVLHLFQGKKGIKNALETAQFYNINAYETYKDAFDAAGLNEIDESVKSEFLHRLEAANNQ